jgi:hypothetical protein
MKTVVRAQAPANLGAVHPREHEVEEEDVRVEVVERRAHADAGPDEPGLETVLLELVEEDIGDVGVVLDHEDAVRTARKLHG